MQTDSEEMVQFISTFLQREGVQNHINENEPVYVEVRYTKLASEDKFIVDRVRNFYRDLQWGHLVEFVHELQKQATFSGTQEGFVAEFKKMTRVGKSSLIFQSQVEVACLGETILCFKVTNQEQ